MAFPTAVIIGKYHQTQLNDWDEVSLTIVQGGRSPQSYWSLLPEELGLYHAQSL
jgi:hypothetical protein